MTYGQPYPALPETPTFVAPPPPPGPGVHPPFPAPPVEGRGRRIGLGFGIGGGIVALVCAGGLAAVVGLGLAMTSAFTEQAHVVVGKYLDAVKAGDYTKAYAQLCPEARARESITEYRARVTQDERIDSYSIGDLDLVTGEVPVDLTYADGGTDHVEAQLGQNSSTGAFEVCSVGE
ncbi:hypothetical protein ACWT_1319 [Actinoplanes sp. SE50]|uniref:hypothetical protein n=1 Tax=unclassified Actinoplanes TaxID=2626549 RepID=UPI00023EBCC8|nr:MULTISPECIES: hypothetical protein [unclassified Actinoplanes]AEV82337.1 hypothetical protein ACPL_1440 [Actinoplanes sp. SE50/110]ATO80734.1 hypothetical protein ACWT_1319 [Actinoplanes sp. SE50]SLL98142.1 hypothetical protein ACSP50_1364 [Actinoplanes sp. SE50/110]